MKFGVILPSYLPQATVEGMRRTALLAEELGYDSVWTTDHVMTGKDTPAPYQSIFEALNTLSWLAGVTSRVKLGVSVLIMTQRNPIMVAKEVATLDAVSGGRAILGLGVGWTREEFGYLNADFHHRGAIMNEGIRVLRHLWSTPDEPFHGKYFSFENQSFAPPPAQPGGPPLWIGGGSEAALRRVATLGDAWHGTSSASPDVFKQAAETIARLKGDRDVALTLRATIGAQGGLRQGPRGPVYTIGGTSQQIRDEVLRYQDLGCSYMALNFWERDLTAQLEGIRRFAAEVMPRV